MCRKRKVSLVYFLPLFLIPWEPVLRGPLLPLVFAASSALAFASARYCQHSSARQKRENLPAFCFSWKALSSSSISAFGAFFGCFKGLALPPKEVNTAIITTAKASNTSSVSSSHCYVWIIEFEKVVIELKVVAECPVDVSWSVREILWRGLIFGQSHLQMLDANRLSWYEEGWKIATSIIPTSTLLLQCSNIPDNISKQPPNPIPFDTICKTMRWNWRRATIDSRLGLLTLR